MYCKSCYYCLKDLNEAMLCPECGAEFNQNNSLTFSWKDPSVKERISSMLFYAVINLVCLELLIDLVLFITKGLERWPLISGVLVAGYLFSFLMGVYCMYKSKVKMSDVNEHHALGFFFVGGILSLVYGVYFVFV